MRMKTSTQFAYIASRWRKVRKLTTPRTQTDAAREVVTFSQRQTCSLVKEHSPRSIWGERGMLSPTTHLSTASEDYAKISRDPIKPVTLE